MRLSARSLFTLLTLVTSLTACGDNVNDKPDAQLEADAAPDPQPVTIPFAAKVGGTSFACGQTYAGIGMTAANYVASDFRFYVHDVRLVGVGGSVPVTLDVNEWQNAGGVALLDFEDGTVDCQMGSAPTHTALTGTAPAGTYTGIEFKVGVPFDQNHLDATTATAPLNIPAMYWAWASGHRFLKMDGVVGGQGFNLHLGSTGCTAASPMTPPTAPCTNPNVMPISLIGYTVGTSTVVADPAPVLADVDVTTNTTTTAPGCMSFPNDPECTTVLPHLGLAYGTAPAGTQVLFTVQ
jgi:uncharacterized repeat protein (TIGR04052 family)